MGFHHRHLPTFTRFTKLIVWKWMHLYWPMMIHYLTDKYEGRLHHLIVDTIYAVISFVLVAANVGLVAWFYLYLTPADVSIQMTVDPSVKSGEMTTVHVAYASHGRSVRDATIHITMPEGFLVGSGDSGTHRFIDMELGDLPKGSTGSFDISGVVYGNIHQTYLFYADMGYRTVGRYEEIHDADRFFINDSAFVISVDSTKASTYDLETRITVRYENTGKGVFDAGRLMVDLPDSFAVIGSELNGIIQSQAARTREFNLGRIEPNQQGTLTIIGTFQSQSGIGGDQTIQAKITPYVSVFVPGSQMIEFEYASQYATVHVIDPYIQIRLAGETAEVYGDTVAYTVTVKNTSGSEVRDIDLFGEVSGRPMLSASTRIDSVRAALSNGTILFPRITSLQPGESRSFRVSVPTQYIAEPNQIGKLSVYAQAYAPLIEQAFDAYTQSLSTRFASRISIASKALYTGPNGEQLGYGPNPPVAWNVTAYRVFLRVDNGNQPVENVVLTTTLPGMSTWTGSYSTSVGTLSYNESTRVVTWNIPYLPANAQNLGAQFEVRFLPNHLQIGLTPYIVDTLNASAFDPFAALTVHAQRGAVYTAPILP